MRFSFTKRDSWVTNGTLALHFTVNQLMIYRFFHHVKKKVCIKALNTEVSVIRMATVKYMIKERNRKQMILLLVWSIHVLEIVLCLLKNYIFLIPAILPICLTLVLVGDYWLNQLYDFEKMG